MSWLCTSEAALRSRPAEFYELAAEFFTTSNRTADAAHAMCGIGDAGWDGFQGQLEMGFRVLTRSLGLSMGQTAISATEARTACTDVATELEALKTESDTLLDTAQHQHTELDALIDESREWSTKLYYRSLERDAAAQHRDDDPDRYRTAVQRVLDARGTLSYLDRMADMKRAELDTSQADFDRIRDRADEIHTNLQTGLQGARDALHASGAPELSITDLHLVGRVLTLFEFSALSLTAIDRESAAARQHLLDARDRLAGLAGVEVEGRNEKVHAALIAWYREHDPAALRGLFESIHGTDPAAVLANLDGDHAVMYWEALDRATRKDLIQIRPELVVSAVLGNGGSVTDAERFALVRVNAYPMFSREFAAEFGVEVGIKYLYIALGGGASLRLEKFSDGHVEVTLVEELNTGVGAEIGAGAEASAEAGVLLELEQVFRFADEQAAAESIRELFDALDRDTSPGELAKDFGGALWNEPVSHANNAVRLANWFNPWSGVPEVPTYDLTPHVVNQITKMWDQYGMSHEEAIGVYSEASAEFKSVVDGVDAEVNGTGSLLFYDSDPASAGQSGAVGQTGVRYAGTLSGSASADVGAPEPANASTRLSGEVGYVVDLYQVDNEGAYLSLTVHGDAAAALDLGLFDAKSDGVSLGLQANTTGSMTGTITVPVNGATAGLVKDAAVELAHGDLPVRELEALYESSEIEVAVATGVETQGGWDVDAGAVEVNWSTAQSETDTRLIYRKHANGDFYSPIDIDRQLVEATSE